MKNYIGNRFGRLTVISECFYKNKNAYCECKCSCGNKKTVKLHNLLNGKTKSCGCFNKELSKRRMLQNNISSIHNLSRTRIYGIWQAIKQRCYNPNNDRYKDYGARNIKIIEEWKNNFISFYNWAMANGYKDNLTIDRINVNGDYCPENCRWITNQDQQNNRRNNHFVLFCGETYTLAQLSRLLNIPESTLWYKTKKGLL